MARGERACREAIKLLHELMELVGAGLRREHTSGVPEQISTRAHTAREAHEFLFESMREREGETNRHATVASTDPRLPRRP